jgi:CTP:molybdopterin cytidylyltransferase MocA/rhodanese-related sulfurtransferase
MTTAALVLAAGAGRRFGATKQLATLRGRPLLEHALAAVTAVSPRVVVLGHAADEIRARADLHGAAPVICPDWEEGQAASLRCGLAALPDADAVLVVLGDQPGLTAAAVDALLAAGGDEDAVRATYGGTPGHPVLLRRPLLARVGELRGDAGFRDLLRDARVRTVEVGHVAAPGDVDAPADLAFGDDFDGPGLDLDVWVPHYLPQWSSRAESAATYEVADSELRLTIPTEQGIWCAGDHEPPLRVSGVQSGVFSGEVGSTVGQQPFRDGQLVREAQETHWGWTPEYGRLEVRARMDLSPRSMASVWMVGLEDTTSDNSGEICVFEIFGDAFEPGSAAVGSGIKHIRDPKLTWEFDAPRLAIDVAEPHDYAAEWRPGRVDFFIDDRHGKTVNQAPDYPLQMIIAVFDFPEQPGPADHVPLLAVDHVRGHPLPA